MSTEYQLNEHTPKFKIEEDANGEYTLYAHYWTAMGKPAWYMIERNPDKEWLKIVAQKEKTFIERERNKKVIVNVEYFDV